MPGRPIQLMVSLILIFMIGQHIDSSSVQIINIHFNMRRNRQIVFNGNCFGEWIWPCFGYQFFRNGLKIE